MPRPITAIVHQSALKNNLAVARAAMPDSQLFAVVKANAYGHGIERVYNAFKSADGFALLDIEEAKRIRALGWTGEILLLEGIFSAQDLYDCVQYQLSFTVHNALQVQWLQQFPVQAQFKVFLKMNSGMNRLGFTPEEYAQIWQQLKACPAVHELVHMTHFSDADGERQGQSGIEYQHQVFQRILQDFSGQCSISNSAAILRYSTQLHSHYIRSGIMLYGSSPDFPTHTIQDWNLQVGMSLRSEIIAIQHLNPNESIGYGSHFIADRPMRVGIVACGYADGYQRISPTGTPVLVDSIRTRTLGRVSMDMLAVDLDPIPSAQIGSEVVLWGQSSLGVILPIDEVAASSGTVGYELMCAVTARVNFRIQE